MGAAACSADGAGQCRSCSAPPRPAFEGQQEYKPQPDRAGLKETVEPRLPPLAATPTTGGTGEDRNAQEAAADSLQAVEVALEHAAKSAACHALGAADDVLTHAAAVAPTLAAAAPPAAAAARAQAAAIPEQASKDRGVSLAEAAETGAAVIQAELLEMQNIIHRNHCSLRFLCLFVALALLISSVLGVLNVLSAVFHPFQYLFACYNVIFAAVILVLDGKSTTHVAIADVRKKLFTAVWCLSSPRGRAAFYFYVGSMNLVMLPEAVFWRIVYLAIGASLCVVGLMTWCHGCICCTAGQTHPALVEAAAHVAQHGAAAMANVMHEAAVIAKVEYLQITAYVQRNPCTLKLFLFFNALALFVASVIGLLNIFEAFVRPFQYLMAIYNVLFAAVIAVLDGRPEWFDGCWNVRKVLLQAAPALGWLVGRACFCLYVGSINLVLLPDSDLWKFVYIGIGVSLFLAGSLMLWHRYICRREELDAFCGAAEDP